MKFDKKILFWIVSLLVVAVLSFTLGRFSVSWGRSVGSGFGAGKNFSGRPSGQFNQADTFYQGNLGRSMNDQRQLGGRGGLLTGEIKEISDHQLILNLSVGGSRIIRLNDNTSVQRNLVVGKDTLLVGSLVNVVGQSNKDNSITANQIILLPDKK